MSADAYGRLARLQDRVLEPLNAPLRSIALGMVAPDLGCRVLDVGCGTGAQLEEYATAGCVVTGVDASEAMLSRARQRLGEAATLRLGDARAMPFADRSFDVTTATLVLHELAPLDRETVMREMARVLTDDGSILVVDFHPGPLRGLKGWGMRGVSTIAELVARHLRRSRSFLADGGVVAVAERVGLRVERTKVVAGGNMALYLIAALDETSGSD